MTVLITLFAFFLFVGIFSQTKPGIKSHIIVLICAVLLRLLGLLEGLLANGGLL